MYYHTCQSQLMSPYCPSYLKLLIFLSEFLYYLCTFNIYAIYIPLIRVILIKIINIIVFLLQIAFTYKVLFILDFMLFAFYVLCLCYLFWYVVLQFIQHHMRRPDDVRYLSSRWYVVK